MWIAFRSISFPCICLDGCGVFFWWHFVLWGVCADFSRNWRFWLSLRYLWDSRRKIVFQWECVGCPYFCPTLIEILIAVLVEMIRAVFYLCPFLIYLFLFLEIHSYLFGAYRLACCRAAVRWACGLAVRRHGQQAVVSRLM